MTSSPPRVSVVLPVYNAERFVGEAIDSILGQTLADFELIVIDDGSTDDTPRILADRVSRDPRIRLIARENRGLTPTLNEGLEGARGPFVAIMNADDIALPERLERQVAFLDTHPAVAAVGSQTRLMLADGTPGPSVSLPQTPADVRRFLPKASPLAHPAVMFRRAAVVEVRGYRPQIEPAEDYDLWLRLADRHELANLPNVLLHYRVHGGQSTAGAFEAVAIATLVAQAAARARQAGQPDPVEGRSRVDRDLAAKLGITPDRIARCAIETALSRSECLLATGAPATVAWEPFEALREHAVARAVPELFAASSRWLEGRVLMAQGRYAQAVPLIVEAAVREPGFRSRLAGALERRVNRSLRGRRP
jgi:hypothetical protein